MIGGHDHLADQRAQQLLAVAVGGRLGRPEHGQLSREPHECLPFVITQGGRAGALERGDLAVLALEVRERLFQRMF